MMRNKRLLSLIAVVSLVLALSLGGCVSGAWFQESAGNSGAFELVADGVLLIIIEVPADPEPADGVMTPAKLLPGALANHEDFDVTRVYNVADPNPSYVERAATVAHFPQTPITFLTGGGGGSGSSVVKVAPNFSAYVWVGITQRTLKEREIAIWGTFTLPNKDDGDHYAEITLQDNGNLEYVNPTDGVTYTLSNIHSVYKRGSSVYVDDVGDYVRQAGDTVFFYHGGIVMTTNDTMNLSGHCYLKDCDEEISDDLKDTTVYVNIALDGSEVSW